jgi:hypothetical protein
MSQNKSEPTSQQQTAERDQLRRQMAIQHQAELEMNSLIQRMAGLVDKSKVAESRMEKHQIKNLLGVALDTRSVEVVKHYILYQVGRDVSGASWRRDDFGKELVKAIESLKTDAERITRLVHDGLKLPAPSQPEIDETWMALVRAFLGQFNRYFYYRKEETR